MAKPLLVVVGATGSQGRSVLNYFQHHVPEYNLRGTTRNPSSDAAAALAKSGIEVVKADANDVESLKKAFEGASAIFAYTAFGDIIKSVMGKVISGKSPPPVSQHAYKIEVAQGKNIADAAATVSGLQRLVWSTLSGPKKWSRGKYTQVSHFDAKQDTWDYMRSLPALEGKVSAVQMGCFANNLVTAKAQFGVSKQADGSYLWRMVGMTENTVLPWIDVEQDTGAFVKALLDAPAHTHVLGVSEDLSLKAYAKMISDIVGISIRYEELPFGEAVQDDPTGIKRQFAETFQYCSEFGFAGGDPEVVTADELEIRGFKIPRSKIADHAKRADWSDFLSEKAAEF